MARSIMHRCEHCRNPHKEFYRTQCLYEGCGEAPCEAEARAKRQRADRQFMIATAIVISVLVGGLALLFVFGALARFGL
jgi:hypothetical protein